MLLWLSDAVTRAASCSTTLLLCSCRAQQLQGESEGQQLEHAMQQLKEQNKRMVDMAQRLSTELLHECDGTTPSAAQHATSSLQQVTIYPSIFHGIALLAQHN